MSRVSPELVRNQVGGDEQLQTLEVSPSNARRDVSAGRVTPGPKRLLRVLVVDDNPDEADNLSTLAALRGHEARVAGDESGALELISTFQPDVLFVDVAVPKMDGCHLVQQLRRQMRFEETLLIALTKSLDEAQRLRSAGAGFDHYLVKPVDPAAVEKLLMEERRRRTESPSGKGERRPNGVLIVDDEAYVRSVLDAGMRRQGFTTWLAASGQEALDLYRRHRQDIDVVLMDVRMPELDGPQTLVGLRELNPHVSCCFMSGDLGDYTEESLQEMGVAAVIAKPFRLAEVAQVLGSLVNA